ncbi:amino acid ABC transporter substrate-binding protein [Ochrobactrum sp. S46]|nr:amino acid ABC transporter substrate-binding protein [Ochrobactrum sp. S45]MBK0046381.1 amino acid ABC transporter substrate-binding protein [Ochrobactrum sp. S46]
MNNRIIRKSIISVAILMGLSATALAQDCKPKHEFKTITPGTLTIAVTTYAPHSFMDESGKMTGLDGDIATEFAKRECLTLKPVAVDPAAAIQYVLSGQADITTGDWYRTAERAKVMNLSYPLYNDQMGLYSKDGVKTVEDLIGKNVGTVQGYLWVTDAKKLLGANLRLYPNSVNMHQDLASGRIDVGIDGYSTGAYAAKNGTLKDIKVEIAQPDDRIRATKEAAQASLPYAKSATDFGAALDANIEEMHKDGTIARILHSYGLDDSMGNTGSPKLIE